MPVQPCPVCNRPTAKLLEACTEIAYVNYYACERCHHVWTASKQTGAFLRHITTLEAQPAER